MAAILAILSAVAGAGATVLVLVFLVAGAANTKPGEWMQIKTLMLGMAATGLVGLGGTIWDSGPASTGSPRALAYSRQRS